MTLEEQFKQVLEHSQQQEFPHSDKLIAQWRTAKKDLINTFLDGQLIKEHPKKVSFSLDETAKRQRYEHFSEYAFDLWEDPSFYFFLSKITAEQFYNNKLEYDCEGSDGKKIPKGTKIIRAFKHFISDPKVLAEIQSAASVLLQENKVTGTLCLSAHPLDYLSSSENTLNWSSCHSLIGQFRSGNLSYMLDSSTLICYLRADEPADIPNFPFFWNNKKWRVLLHVSSTGNMIIAGRQYPFTAASALEKVRKAFLPKDEPTFFAPTKWSHWHNDYITSVQPYTTHAEDEHEITKEEYFHACGRIFGLSDIMEDAFGSSHYNDVLKSTIYTKPYYIFKDNYFLLEGTRFTVGAKGICPHCGQEKQLLFDQMICADCVSELNPDQAYCDTCGRTFPQPEAVDVGAMRMCPDCVRQHCFNCERCGELELELNKSYDNGEFICYNCQEELDEKR